MGKHKHSHDSPDKASLLKRIKRLEKQVDRSRHATDRFPVRSPPSSPTRSCRGHSARVDSRVARRGGTPPRHHQRQDSCDRNQHKRDRSELQCGGEGDTESRQELPRNKYRKITHDDRSPRGSASVISHRHSRADRSPREATSTGIDDDRSLRGSASNVTFSPRDRSPRGSTILEHRDDRSPRGSVLSLDFRDDLSSVLGHPGVSADNEVSENILEGILEEDILGTEDFAPNISEALAKRWTQIIINGLDKERDREVLGRYKIPANCKGLLPPLVNPEIESILSQTQIARDKYYREIQAYVGKGLANLGKTVSTIQGDAPDIPKSIRDTILSQLCDCGNILSNLFHTVSNSRRALILPQIKKGVREIIEKSLASEQLLFGQDLNDKIKDAKALESVAKDLKVEWLGYDLPNPKYDSTWDPGLVLKYFETSTKDDLLFLSKKVAMLLALVTGHRIQTISLIKMINIIESTSGFQILIPDRIKSSGVNKIQPCLNIPFYPTCAKVCPASALKCYIDRTKDIRKNNSDLLFISPRKPHAPVTKQTLSRWLKDVMLLAGVDTRIFTSHSTRHASTSAALRKGLSVDNSQRTAGWTSDSSVFARFYNRPLTSTSFAYSVLK
nr:unnamed protein product [Callosobruchus analis]